MVQTGRGSSCGLWVNKGLLGPAKRRVQVWSPRVSWNLNSWQRIPLPAIPGSAPGGLEVIIEERCG